MIPRIHIDLLLEMNVGTFICSVVVSFFSVIFFIVSYKYAILGKVYGASALFTTPTGLSNVFLFFLNLYKTLSLVLVSDIFMYFNS